MGRPAARVGDSHSCPMSDGLKPHKGGPVLPPGKPTVWIGGMPAATITDRCACRSVPDIIMEGAASVEINGLPAARQYDKTVHGGMITSGCPSVEIGGPSFIDTSLLQYGPEEEEVMPSTPAIGLSIGLDLLPVVGTLKGIIEGITGTDSITGEKLSPVERLIGWIPIVGKAGRVVKGSSKLLKAGDKAANITKAVRQVEKQSPSALARSWQGSGKYPGVDKWRDVKLRKGKVVYAGEPAGSGFYTTEKTLKKAKGNKENLWESVQVKPHPEKGYRKKVGVYEVVGETPAAFGTARQNPLPNGKGGGQQLYIPEGGRLRKIGEIDLN